MKRQKSKSPKRLKPDVRSDKSQEKQESGSKKRKNSQQKDQNNIAKTQTKQSLQVQCFICASPYNLNRKLPVIACKNKHTFCLNCITISIQASKTTCPICRTIMEPQELNSTIYHQVLDIYKQKGKHLEDKLIKKSIVKLSAKKFSKKYSNFDDFESVPKTNKFIKIKRNKEPSLLVLQPQIKDKSKCTYSLIYHPKDKVQISFGVCIYDKFLLKLVENCGFDTKIIDFFMKKDGQRIKKNAKQGMKIVVNVNLQKYELHWFLQRQTTKKGEKELDLISSQQIEINHKVGDLSYYPYCVLYTTGDSIELNT